MFGLKKDWSMRVSPRYFTLDDYEGAVGRWCPGCGDFAVVTAVQKILRDEQLAPERVVNVSGIGCSSRLPHYMATYGFHGLHGRALPVACGVKSRRPDLDVWVTTGDGDCTSIGAGHWIHGIRYNMNMVVMLLDNNVYGLTKKQTSPTTAIGTKTNTHPRGSFLPPLDPLTVTLGVSNVSFVAQTVDWNPAHLKATLHAAWKHKGLGFVRILQRCPTYSDHAFEDLQKDPAGLLLLEHERGVQLDESLTKGFPNRTRHDPADMQGALAVANRERGVPVGLLFQDESRPRYDEFTCEGHDMSVEKRLAGIEAELDHFAI